jgi:pimeloyl-ACP methyl ester carboxylesterase
VHQDLDGVQIHYVEAGQGDPIVFIPGWRMPGWIWQKQINGLSDKYRVPICAANAREMIDFSQHIGGELRLILGSQVVLDWS